MNGRYISIGPKQAISVDAYLKVLANFVSVDNDTAVILVLSEHRSNGAVEVRWHLVNWKSMLHAAVLNLWLLQNESM